MPYVGQPDSVTFIVPAGDDTTALTVTAISPTRVSTALTGAGTDDDGVTWVCLVPGTTYTVPGIWFMRAVATGPGAGTYYVHVEVSPSGYLATPPWAYATTTDLSNYLSATAAFADPLPDGAEGKLHRASQRIDRILLTAIYPVNSSGMPTKAEHIEAFKEATCELVAWWLDTGDESGAQVEIGGMAQAGRIMVSRGAQSAGKSRTRGGWWVSTQVLVILDNAGLTGHAARHR